MAHRVLAALLILTVCIGAARGLLLPPVQIITRRFTHILAAGLIGITMSQGLHTSVAAAAENASPQQQQQQLEGNFFGLKKGRVQACKPRSNCISSSSIQSITQYGRPWVFEGSASDEFDKIISAAKSTEFVKIADESRDQLYIHLTAKSALPPTGIDDLEFLINPADKLITYRSNSREVVFAGTQQVGDAGSHKNRLAGLQRKLGVKDMGDYADELFDNSRDFGYALPSANFFNYQKMANQPDEINFEDNKPVAGDCGEGVKQKQD